MGSRGAEYRGVVISRGEWAYHAGNGRYTVISSAWITTVDRGSRVGFRTRAKACAHIDEVLARVGHVSCDMRGNYFRTVFVDGGVTEVASTRGEWLAYREGLAG